MKTAYRKPVLLCFALLLLIGFACSDKEKVEATQDETELRIAYNVLYDTLTDNYEIFSMDLTGANKKNISEMNSLEWMYNTFGEQLYFVSDRDTIQRQYYLYRMNQDGSGVEKVNDIRLQDSWMDNRKNGAEWIVRPHRSIDTAFYIIDTKGRVLQKLKPKLAYMSDPCFSPTGNQVVFRGSHKPFKRDIGYIDELYIMNSDGSNLTRLTQYPITDTTAQWFNYHAGPPRWHPTENFISYGSYQNGKYNLFAVTPDGKKQWKLMESEYSTVYHDWSPDGKWMVHDVSKNDSPPFHIALTHWETKEMKVLTDSTYQFHQAPVFITKN